ncbi:MAG: DUF1851 domain-containing protein [Flavobacteriales bacterium]|nr:DUF1851 domain-containing protein [Flavobacteriales bacterium]
MENLTNTYQLTAGDSLKPETIKKFEGVFLTSEIVELWKNHGLASLDQGLVRLIDPEEYEDTLATWLGKRIETYIPIAISAFGELFYYRKLTDEDDDICMIDPHYKRIDNCGWSLDSFLNDFLCDPQIKTEVLRENTFKASVKKNGALKVGEIYMFTPALALGGSEEADYTEVGSAKVHLDLLFQM